MITALRSRQWYRVALAFLTITASCSILALLIYRERDVLLAYDWDLRWSYIVASFVVLFIGLILAAAVWADMMRVLGSRASWAQHLRNYSIAHLARRLPGTLWYLAGRSYLYKQQGDSVRLVAVSSGLELIVSVASGATVTLAFFAFLIAELPRSYLVGTAIAAGLGILTMHPAVVRMLLARMRLRNDAASVGYGSVIRWFAVYALIWLLGGLILYLIAAAVTPLPWSNLAYVTGVWCLVGVISVAVFFLPSNLGITEVGLSLLLTNIMPSSVAVLVAIMARLLITLYEIVGVGMILLVLRFFQPALQPKFIEPMSSERSDP